ncbi:diphthine--ammonia ligase [Heyndrickxia sp. NPDC080065]|uniref:Dph6-related ATP pyrophosphatase n=1 Tax=Heyndrickxia sp. NPDC080065 TaxID=3390568 RepID=UPI003D019A01
MERKRLALSWSGGKDSCFALHKLIDQGAEVVCLVTTAPKETGLTFAHGEKIELILAQGKALGIPVHIIDCGFKSYTEDFRKKLLMLKEKYQLDGIAFGDLYLDEHREWGEKLANETGIEAIYPLWMKQSDSLQTLSTFIDTGYQAIVIRVQHGKLPDSWLGKTLDHEFWNEIQTYDVCPMGESGEYHTFVFDGPLFREKVEFSTGKIINQEYSARLEVFQRH